MSGNDFKIGNEKNEKKLSWSIVFAWLYLNTFGKILPKKWNKWAKNIVEPYEVINSNDVTEPGGDKDVILDSELQTEIKAEVINSDEVRQPWDGQSFSLDPQLQTEAEVEITNSDNPEGGKIKVGDSRDFGINDCEDDDFNTRLLLKIFKQSQLNEEHIQRIIQGLKEGIKQLKIESKVEGINSNEVAKPGDDVVKVGDSRNFDDRNDFWYDEDYHNAKACFDGTQLLPKTESDQIELSETEDPEDAVLYARMEILLAELAESNEKYLRHTINEQEKEIAQLKWEIEIAEEALRNTTLKVVKLIEENEQPKHNPTEINALNTRNTTEGTPEKPSTSVTNVEENGYRANLLQSFS